MPPRDAMPLSIRARHMPLAPLSLRYYDTRDAAAHAYYALFAIFRHTPPFSYAIAAFSCFPSPLPPAFDAPCLRFRFRRFFCMMLLLLPCQRHAMLLALRYAATSLLFSP